MMTEICDWCGAVGIDPDTHICHNECLHNAMVETANTLYSWKCADCGYVYGKSAQGGQAMSKLMHTDQDYIDAQRATNSRPPR